MDTDRTAMIVHLIDNKALSADEHSAEAQDHQIDLDDMKAIIAQSSQIPLSGGDGDNGLHVVDGASNTHLT
jgi:hypothetical protein